MSPRRASQGEDSWRLGGAWRRAKLADRRRARLTPGPHAADAAARTMSDERDSATRAQRHGRLPALEGLRGLAALVVVVHHSLLATVPRFAGAYGVGPYPLRGTLQWWLTYSPLHILWGGGEFVVVFFVLSGFVLSLPSARSGRVPRAVSYYPSRFVRLYLPVWGALVFAALVHALVIGGAARASGGDWWLRAFSEPLSLQAA